MSGSVNTGGASASDDMLELQSKLRNDASGAERDRLLGVLEAVRNDAKRRMDQGVAPTEFRTLETITGSAEAAGEVIALAWRRYHPSAQA